MTGSTERLQRLELADHDALVQFFSSVTEHPASVRFAKVAVDTLCRQRVALVVLGIGLALLTLLALPLDTHSLIALLAGVLLYAAVEKWTRSHRQLYVRVWLPLPLATDLQLESRPVVRTGEDRLEARFAWSATSEETVRRYVSGRLLEALEAIAETHRVRMGDRWVEFGPSRGNPARVAALVAGLIEAFPRPAEEGADQGGDPGSEPIEVDADGVVAAVTTSREEADRWCSILAAAGIAQRTYGRETGRPFAGATPPADIRILVRVGDVERARDILSRAETPHENSAGALFCYGCGATVGPGDARCNECGTALTDGDGA